MRYICLIALILLTVQLTGQDISMNGILINSDTGEGVAYANVGVRVHALGTVTDMNGYYEFTSKSVKDEVSFSAIGYSSRTLLVSELMHMDTVFMDPVDYKFEAIEISSTKLSGKDVILGLKNKDRGQSIGFGSAQLGTELGAVIEIDKASYIKSVNFVLNHAKGDSLLMRVNMYAFDGGDIGASILKENVIFREKQRRGVYTMDISHMDLVLDSDVLMTLEWLRDFDEIGNKEITFDTKRGRKHSGIFVRYASQADFKRLDHMGKRKPCFYFIARQVE